jgi:hypothetical protein
MPSLASACSNTAAHSSSSYATMLSQEWRRLWLIALRVALIACGDAPAMRSATFWAALISSARGTTLLTRSML